MLHEFLSTNRTDLIDRCRLKVDHRHSSRVTDEKVEYGIPLFLDQLIKTLRVEQTSEPALGVKVSGPSGGGRVMSEISVTAMRHGGELLHRGYTVEQVVHNYGDLCQAITDLAFEKNASIEVDEFRTLNRCLDNGIAEAVTEFAYQRDALSANSGTRSLNERLGFLAHELRNLINTATLAVTAIKAGNVGLSGATGAVLDRSLIGLRNLIDRSLADVRTSAGMPPRYQLISVADFIAEVNVSSSLEARARECQFSVAAVDPRLAVDADKDMLFSAVGNLLQNAFKFTAHRTEVSLRAYAVADRILIEVEDKCGGHLPSVVGFLPIKQRGADKSGMGFGLSICRRCVEANNGVLSVRDMPGSGCVFTIDLPRHSLAERSVPGEASSSQEKPTKREQ